jgi:signal transduction histidine kinase/CHASE1-domain containing sensor protein
VNLSVRVPGDLDRSRRLGLWWAGAVVVVGIVLTIAVVGTTVAREDDRSAAEFDEASLDAERLVGGQVARHADVLWDLRAYFGTTEFVTRDDFATFLEGEQVEDRYPGTLALGFSPLVDRNDIASFERDVRADESLQPGGYPDFEVQTSSDEITVLPVTYLEPLAGNEGAFGFDVAGDPAGRAAIDAAVETGEPTAGAPLTVPDVDREGKLMMMFLALYEGGEVPDTEEARRGRFQGVVVGLFDVDAMIGDVLGEEPDVELEIFDAGDAGAAGAVPPSEETLLYDSAGELAALDPDAAPDPHNERSTIVGERRWLLFSTAGPGFSSGGSLLPWAIAFIGALLTALIAVLAFEYARERGRAAQMAEGMSGDLYRREQQLQRATEDIVRSNRDLERYATIAAHDLQEPLRSILAYSDLLHRKYEDSLNEEVRDYIDRMAQAAERMRTLVTDLLAYARLETGEHRSRNVDLNAVVQAAIADLTFQIEETGATVDAESLPTVVGNERELIGVFANLLSNALKYRSPERAPVVRISAKRGDDEWLIRVADNGIGIAPDYHLRIFELFRRLGPRDDGAGTGLGLAICARTIAQHGGRIWVESEEGRGATFAFTLPAKVTRAHRPTAETWS